MKLHQSVDYSLGSGSANALEAENDVLRQQLSLISPRMSRLETQAGQLHERADQLHMLLLRRKTAGNTARSFTNATKGSESRSLILSAARFRP
jgi:hypothetical protein